MATPKQIEVTSISLTKNRVVISALFRYHISGDDVEGYTYSKIPFVYKDMATKLLKADMTLRAGAVSGVTTMLSKEYIKKQATGTEAYKKILAQNSFNTLKDLVNA